MTNASGLSALLDANRLMVAGALVGVERTSSDIAEHTGLGERDVLQAVATLRQAGLVEVVGQAYTLPQSTLHRIAAEAADTEIPMDASIGYGMTDEERRVLSRFFQGRTLVEIPANTAKRAIVLERLAIEFDIGRRYPEAEVNEVLRSFHPDHATLRRYLIDGGLLDRERGEYWRSGGRAG